MALTYTTNHVSQAVGVGAAITSGALSVAVGDFITVEVCFADNSDATAWTISNNNTAISWTQHIATNTAANTRIVLFSGTATGTPPTTVTVTATAGAGLTNGKSLCIQVHTGAHASNPIPSGNIFSGTATTDKSQAITPTAPGSCLWLFCGDWNQTNSFAAIANCTLESTQDQIGQFTSGLVRPTTQPRTDASAFTIGETDTGGLISWVAFEVQAAPSSVPVKSTGWPFYRNKRGFVRASPLDKFSMVALVSSKLWPLGFNTFSGVTGTANPASTNSVTSASGNTVVASSANPRASDAKGAASATPTVLSTASPRASSSSASAQCYGIVAATASGLSSSSVAAAEGTAEQPSVSATANPASSNSFSSAAGFGVAVSVSAAISSGSASSASVAGLVSGSAQPIASSSSANAVGGEVSGVSSSASTISSSSTSAAQANTVAVSVASPISGESRPSASANTVVSGQAQALLKGSASDAQGAAAQNPVTSTASPISSNSVSLAYAISGELPPLILSDLGSGDKAQKKRQKHRRSRKEEIGKAIRQAMQDMDVVLEPSQAEEVAEKVGEELGRQVLLRDVSTELELLSIIYQIAIVKLQDLQLEIDEEDEFMLLS